jgi:non-heme chloroperoxidase
MPIITTTDGTQIFYKDWGTATRGLQPRLATDRRRLGRRRWCSSPQNGYRCIAHDRRSHGRSSQTWEGNEMDTYADDLAKLTARSI